MNMGNLNKLALTAQEALQQTLSHRASDAQASQAEPIHMLKALLESEENNLSADHQAHRRRSRRSCAQQRRRPDRAHAQGERRHAPLA